MDIVALGITGHRFLAELDKVMAGVEIAARRILEAFPGSEYKILSSLAEGADRVLAERLLFLPGAALWVPLPLPEKEYLKDFKTPASKQEFKRLLGKAERVIDMPETDVREQAYLAAGKYILDHSDVLLAIWDGNPAQGSAGTGEIVALARHRGLPLIWIHAGNRIPGTETATSLGPGQGKVTFEHFPSTGRKP